MTKNLLSTIILSLALGYVPTIANAAANPLAGTYKVIDCGAYYLPTGADNILVQSDEKELVLGEVFWSGNGGPGSKPYLQTLLNFKVGTERENCMGDCYSIYTSSYSAEGTQFKSVRTMASTMNGPLKFAGETDFNLKYNTLTILSTDDGQFQPGPQTSCTLEKTN